MQMARTTLEITIPILNEEAILEEKLIVLTKFLKEDLLFEGLISRVVVADNGSTDQSGQIMARLCKEYPDLSYLRVDRIGVGLALKSSWLSSNADIVGYMDVDLATSLHHIKEVLDAIIKEDYDFVYGSRLHRDSMVIGRSLKREITSRAFNWILRKYLQITFSDGMCGFKFMKRKLAIELIHRGAKNDGWFFSTELLYLAERLGYKLYELPVEWHDSGDSKVDILKLSMKYLRAMHRIRKVHP